MDINYFREFLMLAETNNYLEAADYLYVSQSTLTRHIQSLEAELNTQLFNRSTRRVELNSHGKLFMPYARQIVQIQNEYTNALANHKKMIDSKLTVGTVPFMVQYNVTNLFVRFRSHFPSVYLEVNEEDSFTLKNMLRRNQLDCAIAWDSENPEIESDFKMIPYTEDTLVAVIPNTHSLAKHDSIRLEDLRTESLLLTSEKSAMYECAVNACSEAGFVPRIGYTGNQLDNLVHVAGSGLGIALLMRKVAEKAADDSVKIVPIDTDINLTRKLCLMYRKKGTPVETVEAFVNFCKDEMVKA